MTSDATTIEPAVVEVLHRFPQVQLAIVFGSCATGSATAASDLDLAVQTKEPLDTDSKLRLIGDLAQRFGRPVDLVDLREAGEPLLGEVLKGNRVLGDDATYAQLITRHLLDAADFLPYRERILAERRRRWIES